MKAADIRAKEEARAAAEAAAIAEADAVLERQSARPDAASAMPHERPAQAGRHRVAGGRRAHPCQTQLAQRRRNEGT